MDTLQLIALIVVALVILAVIIAFRHKLVLALKFLGIDLKVEAANEARPETSPPSAGVRVTDVRSTSGGLLVEEGRSESGPGIEVERVQTKDDIVIGKGESGPKADPPA